MANMSPGTYNEMKHYVSVRIREGVPLLAADWNEMDDIRRFELQAFLKWFVGDGVPYGSNGFKISQGSLNSSIIRDDFFIQAGRCLVNGWEALNHGLVKRNADGQWAQENSQGLMYIEQRLAKEEKLWTTWGVEPMEAFKFPTSNKPRLDLVYLDVWERMVDEDEDDDLVNKAINIPTCTRIKCEWVVRVAQNIVDPEIVLQQLRAKHQDHGYYGLATIGWQIKRPDGYTVPGPTITDLRRTGLSLAHLEDEIADARGMKANLGNRLDESLTKGGQLRWNVVGNEQIKADAKIEETKIKFDKSNGHIHKPERLEGVSSTVTSTNLSILTRGEDASKLHHHKILGFYSLMSISPCGENYKFDVINRHGLVQPYGQHSDSEQFGIRTSLSENQLYGYVPIHLMAGCKIVRIIGCASSPKKQQFYVNLLTKKLWLKNGWLDAPPFWSVISCTGTSSDVVQVEGKEHIVRWSVEFEHTIQDQHWYCFTVQADLIPKHLGEVLEIYNIGVVYEHNSSQ
jgi:hypothetical protein